MAARGGYFTSVVHVYWCKLQSDKHAHTRTTGEYMQHVIAGAADQSEIEKCNGKSSSQLQSEERAALSWAWNWQPGAPLARPKTRKNTAVCGDSLRHRSCDVRAPTTYHFLFFSSYLLTSSVICLILSTYIITNSHKRTLASRGNITRNLDVRRRAQKYCPLSHRKGSSHPQCPRQVWQPLCEIMHTQNTMHRVYRA